MRAHPAPSASLAALEVAGQHSPVLLHVENHRPLHSAGKAGPGRLGQRPPAEMRADPSLSFFLQKRLKAAEADSKLKQVYIPT